MTIDSVLAPESILPGLASEPTRKQPVPGLSPQAGPERQEDRFELSEAARTLLAAAQSLPGQGQVESGGAGHGLAASEAQVEAADPTANKTASGRELSEEDQAEVERLKERDREVRSHERAHVAAGGRYVRGGVQFEYVTGPNGRRYAVGGEVSIDTSPVPGDPEATIQKAQTIRRAALAPAQPSAQDRSAAAAASRMEAEARQELLAERLEGDEAEGPGPASEPQAQGLTSAEHATDKGPPGGLDEFTPTAMGPVIRLEYAVRPGPGQVVDVYG